MKSINKVKIYCNQNEKSNRVLIKLTKLLTDNDFKIVDNNPDLAIAIGGDGAFLRLIKQEKYNSDLLYVGINSGTLGFLQEVRINDIEEFITSLKDNNYFVEEVGVQETNIVTNDDSFVFYSLNEIVIRDKELNTTSLKVNIDNCLLEKYSGDGLLISTSVGSTAYNLSFGGSIIYNTFHTLQITPIAPLNNKAHRSLSNSVVIPSKSTIKITPNKDESKSILVSIDGENKVFDNVIYIKTKIEDKRLKFIHFKNYNYWKKVNEKFLTN